jgi:hypothetical protein
VQAARGMASPLAGTGQKILFTESV